MERTKRFKTYLATFPVKSGILLGAMLSYLLFFSFRAYATRNIEFLYYVFAAAVLFLIVLLYYHQLKFTTPLLVGFVAHWFFHFLGGTLFIDDVRLYDLRIIGFVHYDNIVHALGIFVFTFIAYNLLRPHFELKIRKDLVPFCLLLFLVVMGLGAVSEIGELGAVLWFDASVRVGGYLNNAFDLVYNSVGAIAACLVLSWYEWGHLGVQNVKKRRRPYGTPLRERRV